MTAEALALWPEITEEVNLLKTKAIVVKLVPQKPGLTERLLGLLKQRGPLSARRLQRHLFGRTAVEIHVALATLLGDGAIKSYPVGKTTIYALPDIDIHEQGLASGETA